MAPVKASPNILSDQSEVGTNIAHYTQMRGAHSSLESITDTWEQLWELLGVDQWIGGEGWTGFHNSREETVDCVEIGDTVETVSIQGAREGTGHRRYN